MGDFSFHLPVSTIPDLDPTPPSSPVEKIEVLTPDAPSKRKKQKDMPIELEFDEEAVEERQEAVEEEQEPIEDVEEEEKKDESEDGEKEGDDKRTSELERTKTLKELREMCASLGLPPTGKKGDLAKRISGAA